MKLPAFVWSQIGRIKVLFAPIAAESGDEVPDYGRWEAASRTIRINSEPCADTQITTLFHEMTHVALWDAGGQNVLSDAQTEFVCDALGSYLGGATKAGFLKLQVPRD